MNRMLTLARLKLLVSVLLLTGCQSPFLVLPGGELEGSQRQTESFAFAGDHRLMQLEVNPDAPYSVILRCVVIDDVLYVDAAPARKWGKMIQADPRVRVKLGDALYPATATAVTDESITGRFRDGRTIYRLDPL